MTYEVKEKMNSFGEKHRMFQPNDIVRHFKGNLYRIITIAKNTETKELEVIYESLYPSSDDGKRGVWGEMPIRVSINACFGRPYHQL